MAQQTLNVGTSANAGDGEGLRTGMIKVNDNFDELYLKSLDGWKDNIKSFSGAKASPGTTPTWQDSGNGIYRWLFSAGKELFVDFHVNHDYKQGTDAYIHVHWLSDAVMVSGDTTTWRISYVIAKGHQQGQSLTGALTTFDMVYTADGTEIAGEHIILECSPAQAFDLIEPDTIVSVIVELQATTTAGNIYGLMSDIHYLSDRDATLNKSPNFYV